jgi:hypothetical protein
VARRTQRRVPDQVAHRARPQVDRGAQDPVAGNPAEDVEAVAVALVHR